MNDIGSNSNPFAPIDDSEIRAFAQFTLRMDVELRRQLDARAKSMGITPSELVRNTIETVIRSNGAWINLPPSLIRKIDEGIESGLFIDRNDAVIYYIRAGIESESKEVVQ